MLYRSLGFKKAAPELRTTSSLWLDERLAATSGVRVNVERKQPQSRQDQVERASAVNTASDARPSPCPLPVPTSVDRTITDVVGRG